jgi:hypothetical protein
MPILQLKAARGWSLEQTAREFLVTADTVRSWLQRRDEQRPDALVQLPTPANQFPQFVRYVVQQLKAFSPMMGKLKIAQILARAGSQPERLAARCLPDARVIEVGLELLVALRRPGNLRLTGDGDEVPSLGDPFAQRGVGR